MGVYLSNEENPQNLTAQLYEILLKSARRCAYDLSHAINCIPSDSLDSQLKNELELRAQWWQELFTAGNNMKDYRLSYVHDISKLESEVGRLTKLCKENGIDPMNDWMNL